MRSLELVRQNSGGDLLAARLKRGLRITMNDGWAGTIRLLLEDAVYCEKDGANPHWTGRVIRRKFLKIDGNKVLGDWKLSELRNDTRRSAPSVDRRPHRSGNVVDIDRARLDREWQAAPAH